MLSPINRDGGRFGVAAARGAVGRSHCAVDRAQRPEFGGNSAGTPPAWPEAASRGRYRSSRPIPLECALEKEMATYSSILAWKIPGMGEPGGLPSMGSHRVGHD